MESILSTFGIDWRLLTISMVNFGLLLLGLWYFLYTPVLKMLEERRQKVQAGVLAAQAAQDRLAEVEAAKSAALAEAGKEADALVSQARSAAGAKERELLAAGESAAASIIRDAEAQAAEMKSQAIAESKQEVAKLIVLGMEKALQK